MRASLLHLARRGLMSPDNIVLSKKSARCDGCDQIFLPRRLIRWTIQRETNGRLSMHRWFCKACDATLLEAAHEGGQR